MVFLHGGAICPVEVAGTAVGVVAVSSFGVSCFYAVRFHLRGRKLD